MYKRSQKKYLDIILKFSFIYNGVQNILGARQFRREVVNFYMMPAVNDEILDFGSGTSEILECLSRNVKYIGIEPNNQYIETAKKKFQSHTSIFFEQGSINVVDKYIREKREFDIVLILAVLHHLSDKDSIAIVSKLTSLLKANGKLVLIDPVKHARQNLIARLIMFMDRGANIKNIEEYQNLIAKIDVVASKQFTIRKDLLNIPYSHVIAILQK